MTQELSSANPEWVQTLYRQGGQLEKELWRVAQCDPFAEMTREQAHSFNIYLRQAQKVLPAARTLKEVGEETLVSEVHLALRGTLIPELEKVSP